MLARGKSDTTKRATNAINTSPRGHTYLSRSLYGSLTAKQARNAPHRGGAPENASEARTANQRGMRDKAEVKTRKDEWQHTTVTSGRTPPPTRMALAIKRG